MGHSISQNFILEKKSSLSAGMVYVILCLLLSFVNYLLLLFFFYIKIFLFPDIDENIVQIYNS